MHPPNTAEGTEQPGAPERRVAAAEKQLRIVREIVGDDRQGVDGRIAAAIDEVEAVRSLLE